jgi:hypothetical protein
MTDLVWRRCLLALLRSNGLDLAELLIVVRQQNNQPVLEQELALNHPLIERRANELVQSAKDEERGESASVESHDNLTGLAREEIVQGSGTHDLVKGVVPCE